MSNYADIDGTIGVTHPGICLIDDLLPKALVVFEGIRLKPSTPRSNVFEEEVPSSAFEEATDRFQGAVAKHPFTGKECYVVAFTSTVTNDTLVKQYDCSVSANILLDKERMVAERPVAHSRYVGEREAWVFSWVAVPEMVLLRDIYVFSGRFGVKEWFEGQRTAVCGYWG
ncbi:hypothetical protein LTR09_003346 [Extremus antarcticus]|uniref:Uncharacterized protein n=1 Tax=Extremus antarcticus TaxID=702011 RepID=A0AAJ0DJP9_9PEZI|nr:hypothetical protein LTR09_003346 [Extremus antarcticus]